MSTQLLLLYESILRGNFCILHFHICILVKKLTLHTGKWPLQNLYCYFTVTVYWARTRLWILKFQTRLHANDYRYVINYIRSWCGENTWFSFVKNHRYWTFSCTLLNFDVWNLLNRLFLPTLITVYRCVIRNQPLENCISG